MKINKYNLLSISLVYGMILSGLLAYYAPAIRLFVVAILGALMLNIIYKDISNNHYKNIYIFFNIIVILMLLSIIFSYSFKEIKELYFYIIIFLGFFFYRNYEYALKIIKPLIYINLILMVYEQITMHYVLNTMNHYIFGLNKGIFYWTKQAGAFILVYAFMVRKEESLFYLFILFISTILSGSRMTMVGMAVLLIIEIYYRYIKTLKYKKYIKRNFISLVLFIVFASILLYFYMNWYSHASKGMYERIFNAFNIQTRGNQFRIMFWLEYLNIYTSYDFLHILFGYNGYARTVVGNGAESAYLQLLTDGGIFIFFIYAIAFIYFATKAITINFYKYYPFLLIIPFAQFSRFGVNYAEGILLWGYMFYLLNNSYCKYNKIRRI